MFNPSRADSNQHLIFFWHAWQFLCYIQTSSVIQRDLTTGAFWETVWWTVSGGCQCCEDPCCYNHCSAERLWRKKKGAIRTLPAPITGPVVVCFCQMEHTKNNNKKKNIQPVWATRAVSRTTVSLLFTKCDGILHIILITYLLDSGQVVLCVHLVMSVSSWLF